MTVAAQSEPVVKVTESAARELKEMLAKQGPGKVFRVFVEEGGCSGLSYGMTFDEEREGDHSVQHHGVTVVVDKDSAEFLRGAQVDFSDALTGGGFKISNPNARTSCGCGKSFEA